MCSTFLAEVSSDEMLPVRVAMHTEIVKILLQVFVTVDLSTGSAGQ
jgi:hypothetical protein